MVRVLLGVIGGAGGAAAMGAVYTIVYAWVVNRAFPADPEVGISLGVLVGSPSFWLVVLLGFVLGVSLAAKRPTT
jgi:hypothetical protein